MNILKNIVRVGLIVTALSFNLTRVRQKDKLYKNRDTLSKICFTA